MTIFEKLKYALWLLIAVSMAVGLTLSLASADVVGIIPSIDVGSLLSSPFYFIPVYLTGFIIAPWLSEHLPRKRNWQ